MEEKHQAKARASFVRKEKYKKMQLTHPTELLVSEESQETEVEEHAEWYEVNPRGEISVFNEPELGTAGGGVEDEALATQEDICPAKSDTGNRVFKAQFGRRRTHNEQTLVRPCGIIYARATMFGAEAVSNFLVSLSHSTSPINIVYEWQSRL